MADDLVHQLLAKIAQVEEDARAAYEEVGDARKHATGGVRLRNLEAWWTHASNHPPSAALAMCAAHKEIIADHTQGHDSLIGLCVVCGIDGQNIDCTYPCDTLRRLARAYGVPSEVGAS
jgi:hypothetical protein